MRCTPVRAHARKIYDRETHAYESYAREMHAYEVHAHETPRPPLLWWLPGPKRWLSFTIRVSALVASLLRSAPEVKCSRVPNKANFVIQATASRYLLADRGKAILVLNCPY